MAQQDGGPAFPIGVTNNSGKPIDLFDEQIPADACVIFGGMSLRDYFAARESTHGISEALAELLVKRERPKQSDPARPSYWLEMAQWWAEAEGAYRYMRADAMLKARES